MPIILNKTKVLDGRGIVGKWGNGNCAGKFVYRERIPNTKRYRFYTMEGVTSLSEAEQNATQAAIALASREVKEVESEKNPDELTIIRREERLLRGQQKLLERQLKGDRKSIPVNKAIKEFMDTQWKRVDAGVFALNSWEHKKYALMHLDAYFKYKDIKTTIQINETTFDDYLVFRSKTTRIAQARELSVIGEWIKSYLIKNKLIDSSLWIKGGMLPKVEIRMIDRMANPAINDEDWRTIINYVRGPYREEADYVDKSYQRAQRVYFRNLFWHYLLVSKNSGMSPEEVLKLKWKNIEIRDVGRISESKAKKEIEELLDDGIEVMGDSKTPKGAWAQSHEEFGREERLIAYITTIRSKTKSAREIPTNLGSVFRRWIDWQKEFCRNHAFSDVIKGDDLVFANPFNGGKSVHDNRVRYNFRQVVDKLQADGKLKGHKFSHKRYTLYSMRSTFIENHLIKGTDIFLLARIAGHDVKTLMQSYERMDIRKRAEEITHIEYGKTKGNHQEINLLSDESEKEY